MSQAEALLNQAARSGMYTASPETEPHIVIGADRVIVVPDELKRLAVQFDHNIETVVFDCPRYWDDTDMSLMTVYINYERKDAVRGQYIAESVNVDKTDSTMMHFEWTISKNVTLVEGTLKFNVCIKGVDEEGNETEHWNSELCEDCYISTGLETSGGVESVYPDVITQLKTGIDNILASGLATDIEVEKVGDTATITLTGPRGQEIVEIKDGHSGVYVGSGEMPEGCNIQIDPSADGIVEEPSDDPDSGSTGTSTYMATSVYDPDGAVYNAGGIPEYVATHALTMFTGEATVNPINSISVISNCEYQRVGKVLTYYASIFVEMTSGGNTIKCNLTIPESISIGYDDRIIKTYVEYLDASNALITSSRLDLNVYFDDTNTIQLTVHGGGNIPSFASGSRYRFHFVDYGWLL